MQSTCNFERRNIDEITTAGIYDYDSRLMTARNLSKGTQTDYRDSEAQTIPWEPPYKIAPGSTPAVLALAGLSWGNGLPAGIDELKIIKRMGIKKAWESVLPPLDCKVNVQLHKAIIAMIDKDEWAFRDKELQLAMDSKLEWINKITKVKNSQRKMKLMERFKKVGKYLSRIKSKEMNHIKRELNRELRKLGAKYREKNLQLNKITQNIPKKSTDFKEDFYLFKSKLDDQSFYDILLKGKMFYDDKKAILTQEKNVLQTITHRAESPVAKKYDELCSRETRWTEEKLKKLHTDLKKIRLNTTSKKINCL